MTFNFTEEQVMIRDMVREFTKKEVEPRDKWMDENGFDYELHKKLTQAGLMGIRLDEEVRRWRRRRCYQHHSYPRAGQGQRVRRPVPRRQLARGRPDPLSRH